MQCVSYLHLSAEFPKRADSASAQFSGSMRKRPYDTTHNSRRAVVPAVNLHASGGAVSQGEAAFSVASLSLPSACVCRVRSIASAHPFIPRLAYLMRAESRQHYAFRGRLTYSPTCRILLHGSSRVTSVAP